MTARINTEWFGIYSDLHHGPFHEATSETDVDLHGNRAFDYNAAALDYFDRLGVKFSIHCGDESSFVKGDLSRHLNRAMWISNSMGDRSLEHNIIRNIGNHDPIDHLTELGFIPETYMAGRINRNGTRIVACQPTIRKIQGKTTYSYNADKILRKIPKAPLCDRNVIVSAHWAFDRALRGYPEFHTKAGYDYKDNTAPIQTALANAASRNINRVFTFHGHEHRFSWTNDLGFNCIVMPSIVQADIDNPEEPCGLIALISNDGPNNSLQCHFRKLKNVQMGNHGQIDYEVVEVDKDYMRRYERPVARLNW